MMNNKLTQLKAIYGELVDIQLDIESRYKNKAETRMLESMERIKTAGQASESSLGKKYIDHKLDDVLFNMKTLVEDTVTPKRGVKPKYHHIIMQLTEIYKGNERELYGLLGLVPFSALINGVFGRIHQLSNLAQIVGLEIQNEAKMQAFINTNPDIEKSIEKGIEERVRKQYKVFYAKQRMKHAAFQWEAWSPEDSMVLGCKLIELVIAATGYFSEYQEVTAAGSSVLEIRPNQELLDAWGRSEGKMLINAYRLVPTVIPPQPWEDFTNGGYWGALSDSSTLLRLHDANGQNSFSREYLNRLNQLELKEVRAAVNAVQATPWKINKRVLEVAQAIITRGGNMADLPLMDKLPELPELVGKYTEEQLKAHKKAKADRYRLDGRRLSKAYRVRTHIEIAKEYASFDRIYFPWNMDFRGRCYPIPSFSPQGDDLNKGLLLFADAPACNTMEDIEWLMVHGANLAGQDKIPFEARKQWVRDNEEYILAAAADPMSHISWWGKLDCPMQFIGFCFEWAAWKTYEAEHGTPKGWSCGIAIAFDGTCSGLQHFGAILRDPIGGGAVNLMPTEAPQDIYGLVAAKVNEKLKVHAVSGSTDEEREGENGIYIKYGTKHLAQEWLNYGVNRKVTKRSVMTLAYGSKVYGFKEQLLEDIIEPAQLDAGDVKIWLNNNQAAVYLAKLIWEAVGQVVVKAVEGMKWLQDMAKLVCKGGHTVLWETPMGLPVQQAYMETKNDVYRLRFGGEFKRLYTYKCTGNIHKKHQASGIAPNFIHSMDAAHLQLTILMAKEAGINHFAMIHDSYGAPVSQAGLIFKTTREAFIKMYTENDVLTKFREDMEIYIEKGEKVPAIPSKGDLDLEVIREALYTFH